MKRTPPAASVVLAVVLAVLTVAGCGGDPEPAGDAAEPTTASAVPGTSAPAPVAPAAPGDPAPGVPALTGTPTDLTAPTQAEAGSGQPPTELLTQDVVVGDGPAATLDDTVAVRYTGTLYSDGTVFDSSWSRGDEPITFPLEGVVPGFAQGIEGMQVGGRRVIVMPPELGYGDNPPPGIPAGATLVFVVDLVAIR